MIAIDVIDHSWHFMQLALLQQTLLWQEWFRYCYSAHVAVRSIAPLDFGGCTMLFYCVASLDCLVPVNTMWLFWGD